MRSAETKAPNRSGRPRPADAAGSPLGAEPTSVSTIARAAGRALVTSGPVAYFAWLLIEQVRSDWPALVDPRPDLDTLLAVLAAAYLGLLLVSYWHKPPSLATRHDWRAVLATVLAIDALGLSAAQPVTQPDARVLAAALTLTGTVLAFWSAWYLGRNFSLLPQARTLVTTGPYRFVRHPIYLGGLLITIGEIWLRCSTLTVVLNLLFVAAQIVRLRYEEALLERTFPEYAAYRAQTSALIPGIA
jgi:protein-S-isoprenylcysteine O-methyltransferase Ste14